tara:strand:+ start:565 stop:702 length:138 start_codon:yes stop_codon:yes gene_type:complete
MENDGAFVYGVLVLLSAVTLLGMFVFALIKRPNEKRNEKFEKRDY